MPSLNFISIFHSISFKWNDLTLTVILHETYCRNMLHTKHIVCACMCGEDASKPIHKRYAYRATFSRSMCIDVCVSKYHSCTFVLKIICTQYEYQWKFRHFSWKKNYGAKIDKSHKATVKLALLLMQCGNTNRAFKNCLTVNNARHLLSNSPSVRILSFN